MWYLNIDIFWEGRARGRQAARLERLAVLGHELRRPEADYLRNGLFELRVRHGTVNDRMIYFFHGKHTAVLVEGLVKKDRVPTATLARALRRKQDFERDPTAHTYTR